MKYKNILSPSILSADFGNLARDIHTIDEAGAEADLQKKNQKTK